MSTNVEITINSNIDATKNELKSAILRGLEAIGMTAEGYAKKDTPVRTGRLRNSITHYTDDREQAEYIGTNVEYAPYIEDGSRHGKGHHMLRNAATQHTTEYNQLMEASIKAINS